MKKSTLFLSLSVVSVILCLILSPLVCMPVDTDEIMGTFEVSLFEPVIAAILCSAVAAIFANLFIKEVTDKNGTTSPMIMNIGLVLFGLFYGLRTAYADASNVLSNFYFTWGSSGSSMSRLMPEWADKFQQTASTHTILMVVSILVAAFGIYKVYKSAHR